MNIFKQYIPDQDNILWLLEEIIESFGLDCFVAPPWRDFSQMRKDASARSEATWQSKKGLPLGNLTSQLFINLYMNEFDQFVKHKLKLKYYIRYADDFVFLSDTKNDLTAILSRIAVYLNDGLKLSLHPNKIILKTFSSGLDFLGWVNFPQHRVLRAATKRRMMKKVNEKNISSYLGLLKHGNTRKISTSIPNLV
ncbi:MAG: hypothetical protein A3B10_00205 [Candidatus Doudnabacteria bacterium RIFCSPLOWO2_01_FULL_44_21]|uniref:Reverse transcriptase domain-containing protein n=1 Tax=Candidatus Doudnabacteria bacterium RIFCSPLOWO2_01_FULL_44_21 TaxID=1817841 RepID=A0A1F5PYB1_9BACT|nr:MAG: hypothetical protein A3B95_03660 [Candidatus Doudnabacteria bacterium RIFCSPHIGHO2_02_FULL_43_13b]OGE94570.1 MAG: hypothetical protein A3B10_00205 [Candidatus Doudnabacteria bacterium RIFCSPLOWO2_01_FULL_44_21]